MHISAAAALHRLSKRRGVRGVVCLLRRRFWLWCFRLWCFRLGRFRRRSLLLGWCLWLWRIQLGLFRRSASTSGARGSLLLLRRRFWLWRFWLWRFWLGLFWRRLILLRRRLWLRRFRFRRSIAGWFQLVPRRGSALARVAFRRHDRALLSRLLL